MESPNQTPLPSEPLPAALAESTRVKKSKKVGFEIRTSAHDEEPNIINVVACEPIKAGELLLEESPVLSAPIAEFYDKVCHVCFKESPNVQRCSGCKYSHYCGQDHQAADWTRSHKKECGYYKKLAEKFPQKPLLHLLVLLVKSLVKLHDLKDESFSQMFNALPLMKKPSKKTNEISAKIAQTIRDLELTKNCPEIEDLIEHTLRIMENSNLLQGKKHMDDWVACGIFPITKKVKHSCVPNSFTSANLGLSYRSVAARDIEKGEQITASFVDLDQDPKWRKQQLLENFSITCECPKCLKEVVDPVYQMSPFLANKGYFTPPTSLVDVQKYVDDCKEHLPNSNYAWFRAFDVVSESLKKLGEHEFYFGLLQFMLPKYEEIYKECRLNPVLGALYHKAAVLAHRLGDPTEAVNYATIALRLLEPYFTEKHVLELKVILRHHQSYSVTLSAFSKAGPLARVTVTSKEFV